MADFWTLADMNRILGDEAGFSEWEDAGYIARFGPNDPGNPTPGFFYVGFDRKPHATIDDEIELLDVIRQPLEAVSLPTGGVLPQPGPADRVPKPSPGRREPMPMPEIPPGADLRDFNVSSFSPGFPEGGNGDSPDPIGPAILPASALAVRVGGPLSARMMRHITGIPGISIGSRLGWGTLPAWFRTGLAAAGFTGATVVVDQLLEAGGLPSIPGIGGGGGLDDIPFRSGWGNVGVVGGWTANGVQFYRLSNGYLAVQNKLGRWKVWKPKKPIVIYPGGKINLRTMLKADKVLTRQAKQIASMLNRRAPRSKPKTPAHSGVMVTVPGEITRTV